MISLPWYTVLFFELSKIRCLQRFIYKSNKKKTPTAHGKYFYSPFSDHELTLNPETAKCYNFSQTVLLEYFLIDVIKHILKKIISK